MRLPHPIDIQRLNRTHDKIFAKGYNHLLKKLTEQQKALDAELEDVLRMANGDPEKAAVLLHFKRAYLKLMQRTPKKKAPE